MKTKNLKYGMLCVLLIASIFLNAQNINFEQRLQGIDQKIEKILKDWNVPGCGIGIVYKDKLVFAKGYGYRNLEKKQPVTPNTLFQIASNTKLFTATAIGFLVEDGKLEWDKPIKKSVPQIQFYNDNLDANVTIRDMLSHRTGISRHDGIWYKSDFARQELFDRLKYLEPSLPLRSGYLYNNLMYAASGHIVEILSGKTWETFTSEKIFSPLNMSNSMFVVEDMQKQADFMAPYYEKRDTNILLPFPFYTKQQGLGPAGSIISNINDLSNWLIAQMNGGKFKEKQVIPLSIIKETMQPASITASVPDKYYENMNAVYGMGRGSSIYKGHYRVQHTGAIGGIYSHISLMLPDSIGVIVFTNGAHAGGLPSIIANTVYDQVLQLEATPWSDRSLKDYVKRKMTDKEARQKPDIDRVPNTKPSHALADYAGIYEDAAYGKMEINYKNDNLSFTFNNTTLPLSHYHYDRFQSSDDEIDGKWTLRLGLMHKVVFSKLWSVWMKKKSFLIKKQKLNSLTQTF
jgi:CubicO group peptidase (beta-lactamase class C family)